MGSSNESSHFGPAINPWRARGSNSDLVPGGSSGGSAAAVAAHLALAATGTDTGGSIRQPAAHDGDRRAEADLRPLLALGDRRLRLIARSGRADDPHGHRRAPILLKVMASHDAMDSTSADIPVPDYEAGLNAGVKGLRVGIPKEYRVDGAPSEIDALWAKGAEWLKAQGAEIVEVSLPHTKYALAAYYIVAPAEASSNLARYDGVRYGHRTEHANDLIELYEKSRAEGFGREVLRRIMIGTYVLSAGYYDAYYLRAQRVRNLIARDFTDVFKRCDILLAPITPCTAFALGEKTADPVSMFSPTCSRCRSISQARPGLSARGPGFQRRTSVGTSGDRQSLRRSNWCSERAVRSRSPLISAASRTPGGRRHEHAATQIEADRGHDRPLGSGYRHGSPRPGVLQIEIVLRRLDRVRRRTQLAGQPRRCRDAGHCWRSHWRQWLVFTRSKPSPRRAVRARNRRRRRRRWKSSRSNPGSTW